MCSIFITVDKSESHILSSVHYPASHILFDKQNGFYVVWGQRHKNTQNCNTMQTGLKLLSCRYESNDEHFNILDIFSII
jgi:hypothetical protein